MKKILFSIVLILTTVFFSNLNAQVTIGSNAEPNSGAVLDLISGGDKLISGGEKGLLMPRVALTSTRVFGPVISTDGTLNNVANTKHTEGMTVYNTATNNSDTGYEVSPGYYYNDGTKWVRLPSRYTNWFFMPSVSFNTSAIVTNQTKDLYALYKAQFMTPAVKSTTAPASLPYAPAATDMYYYITEFDTDVFENVTVDDNGLMKYDVKAGATDCSYINIVFVLK